MEREDKDYIKYKEILQKLPYKAGTDLVILKGHLIIEEILQGIIDRKLENPEGFDEAGLTFYQRVCLASALYKLDPLYSFMWSAVKKLNKIRNDLAHQLESKGIQDKINDFVQFVERQPKRYFKITISIIKKSLAV